MSNIVLGTVDQGGDGLVILLAAVSAAKGKDFQMEDFVFTNPQFNTNPTFQRNSFIKMQPLAASGYYGVNTIYYNRINGSELGIITLAPDDILGKTLISELLPSISEMLDIYIKSTDIVDGPIPEPEIDGNTKITLVFSETSIIYYSGAEVLIPSQIYQEKLKELIVTTGYSSVIEFNRQIIIVADPHELYVPGDPNEQNNNNTAKNGDVLLIKNNTQNPTNIYWGNYLVKNQVPTSPMVLPPGATINCIYSSSEKSFF